MLKPLILSLVGLICMQTGTANAQEPSSPSSTPAPSRWEAEVRAYEKADEAAPPPKGAVLFIGSSSIRMWEDLEKDFPRSKLLNRGFGGSQIEDSTALAERLVFPYEPRMIVLYAGDNDLAAGKTPERVFEDYKAFVDKVRERLPKARIAFISIKPSPSRRHLMPKMKAANDLIRRHARRNRNLAYIDVFTPMLDAKGEPRAELFLGDNLHMNEKGYAIWKTVVAPYLRERRR